MLRSLEIKHILIVASIVRLILIFFNNFILKLPQSGVDTNNFHLGAIQIMNDWPYSLQKTLSSGAVLFSSLGALIYSLFGVSKLIWTICLVPFGILTIFYLYKLVFIISGDKKASVFAALVLALFPNVAILQSLLLRESIIHFLIFYSLYHLVKFAQTRRFVHLFIHIFSVFLASIFHSGCIALFFASAIALIFIIRYKSLLVPSLLILFFVSIALMMESTGWGLDKFGGSFRVLIKYALLGGQQINDQATSNYSDWLLLKGSFYDIVMIPLRSIAFYGAPLIPFFVKIKVHWLVAIDSLCYIFLMVGIVKSWKMIMVNKYLQIVSLYILFFTLAYSFGASNFSTNARHRAKIASVLIILPVYRFYQKMNVNTTYKSI